MLALASRFATAGRMIRHTAFAAILALCLAGCGARDDADVAVGVIGADESLYATGLRFGEAAGHLRAATMDGLVGFDEYGRVVPALADRWIVTDDGTSYIFRLRDGNWGDGSELTSASVKQALDQRIAALEGTTLGRDLAIVRDVRAMAARVVEIRLRAPMPEFLALVAQPELTLSKGGEARGQMILNQVEGGATLAITAPALLGQPQADNWGAFTRPVTLRTLSAEEGVTAFDDGLIDVLLGGTLADLPLAPTGPLSQGTVRIDPGYGLFGLRIRRLAGVLADANQREALAMAIDRDTLIEPFGLGGWEARTGIVPPPPGMDAAAAAGAGLTAEAAWAAFPVDERRTIAARRIATWRAENGGSRPLVAIYLPEGPGMDLIYSQLTRDFAAIGVAATRAQRPAEADLVLVDRTARYSDPRWFVNQFACQAARLPCSEDADTLVEASLVADGAERRAALLEAAQQRLAEAQLFIALGQPVRWSLARGSVTGFAPNARAFHPLPPLARIPR